MNRTTVHKKMPDVLRSGRLRYNTCVREADALGMSYGRYVADGLDQMADAIGRDADEPTA